MGTGDIAVVELRMENLEKAHDSLVAKLDVTLGSIQTTLNAINLRLERGDLLFVKREALVDYMTRADCEQKMGCKQDSAPIRYGTWTIQRLVSIVVGLLAFLALLLDLWTRWPK